MVSLLRSSPTSSGWNNSLAASVTVDDGLSATKERIARSRSPIGTVYRMTSLLYDCSQKILRRGPICAVAIVTLEEASPRNQTWIASWLRKATCWGCLQTIIDLSMMMGYCSSATDHCLLCADSCYRWLAVPASRLLLEKLIYF